MPSHFLQTAWLRHWANTTELGALCIFPMHIHQPEICWHLPFRNCQPNQIPFFWHPCGPLKFTCILCSAGCEMSLQSANNTQVAINERQHHHPYQPSPSHNDLLFTAQVSMGVSCLMCLSGLTWPESIALAKLQCNTSLEFLIDAHNFWLPGRPILWRQPTHYPQRWHPWCAHPFSIILSILWFKFPHFAWTMAMCQWDHPHSCLVHQLIMSVFPSAITGQSMRARKATALVERDVPPNLTYWHFILDLCWLLSSSDFPYCFVNTFAIRLLFFTPFHQTVSAPLLKVCLQLLHF